MMTSLWAVNTNTHLIKRCQQREYTFLFFSFFIKEQRDIYENFITPHQHRGTAFLQNQSVLCDGAAPTGKPKQWKLLMLSLQTGRQSDSSSGSHNENKWSQRIWKFSRGFRLHDTFLVSVLFKWLSVKQQHCCWTECRRILSHTDCVVTVAAVRSRIPVYSTHRLKFSGSACLLNHWSLHSFVSLGQVRIILLETRQFESPPRGKCQSRTRRVLLLN